MLIIRCLGLIMGSIVLSIFYVFICLIFSKFVRQKFVLFYFVDADIEIQRGQSFVQVYVVFEWQSEDWNLGRFVGFRVYIFNSFVRIKVRRLFIRLQFILESLMVVSQRVVSDYF